MNPSGDRDAPLKRGQYRSFARRMPILYVSIAVSLVLQIVVFHDRIAWPVSIALPLLLLCPAIVRGLWWQRHKNDAITVEQAAATLGRSANVLVACSVIAVIMDTYIFYHTEGLARYFVVYKLTSIGACLYLCLLNTRTLALLVTCIIFVPSVVLFLSMGEAAGFAAAILSASLVVTLIVIARGYFSDFAELMASKTNIERLNEENSRLARADFLTRLPNRRTFFAALVRDIDRAQNAGGTLALGIVDLDGFKAINDTHGHRVGDAVLVEVAERLRRLHPDTMVAYRIGGDEFAVIFQKGGMSSARLTDLGDEIVDAIRPPISVGSIVTSVGCSIGFSILTSEIGSHEQLIDKADFALYHAKRTGRSRTCVFSFEHQEAMSSQGLVEQALRDGDLGEELYPVFQPIVRCETGTVIAFEALARWHSPLIGPISPAVFIPAAEQIGMVGEITRIVLRKTLACMRQWPDEIRASLNLSAHDISNRGMVEHVVDAIVASGLRPQRIIIEVTETALLRDVDLARTHILLFRSVGCSVALDDFGTGYSSLGYIQQLPFDKIKIDRSFISNINDNVSSRRIVKSILGLCRDMQIDSIVEGVETQDQLSTLVALGCETVQGYYFGKPTQAEELGPFFHRSPQARQTRDLPASSTLIQA